MSTIDDGGPAFPVPTPGATDGRTHDGGMTLRDWLAGQALAGELASQSDDQPWIKVGSLAARCYEIADAMLAARKGGGA